MPLRFADAGRFGQEVQPFAGSHPGRASLPRGEDLLTPRLELARQALEEIDSPRCQDPSHGVAHRWLILGKRVGSMRSPVACWSINASIRRDRVSSRFAFITHHVICRR